ncbi:MAG: Smr/MutS family protein [Myxococcota bacterium]|nr:Smr/MutS family protein [Myxococcota bacterium]
MPFRVETGGGRLRGLAEGVDSRHLRALERGEREVEAELDLHGLRAAEARQAVRQALHEAHEEGMRCIRVIHGRGRGSELGPVLREALPDWLTAPPAGRLVMAFASAPGPLGGEGATLVLLRRRRAPRA